MLRRIVISLLVVTSLLGQVGSAFACRMTGEVTRHHCACPHDATGAMAQGKACCDLLPLIGDAAPAAWDRSLAALPELPPLAAPTAAPAVASAPVPVDASPPPAFAGSGRHTYLRTARLRL
jgi:hypothetical protein